MAIITNIDKLRISEIEENNSNYKILSSNKEGLVSVVEKDFIFGGNVNTFPFTQIQLKNNREPLIPIDTDIYEVREMGNIIYSELLGKYIVCWSQGLKPYSNEIYVHIAVSDYIDRDWQVIGQVTNDGSEDPYILEENGTLYLLVERKIIGGSTNDGHDDIGLWKLTDTSDLLNGWTDLGYALQKDPSKDWQSKDISSPTYIRKNGTSYLFFEGRGEIDGVYQGGAIGLATSSGIEDVFTQEDLIFSGEGFHGRVADIDYVNSIVPDDIFKIADTYYLSCHGLIYEEGIPSYYTVIIQSKDLINWGSYLSNYITYSIEDNKNGSGANYFAGLGLMILEGGLYIFNWGVGNGREKSEELPFQLVKTGTSFVTKNISSSQLIAGGSVIISDSTKSFGGNSVSIGNGDVESNIGSVSIGRDSVSLGSNSVAIGINSKSIRSSSVSIGYKSESNLGNSVCIGYNSATNGTYAISIGISAYSNESSAISIGRNSVAKGINSISIGRESTAESHNEVNIGSYPTKYVGNSNSYVLEDRAFNVGAGANDSNRKDVITILKSGKTTLPEQTISHINSDAKAVVTKEYLEENITLKSPNGTMFRLTVEDDGTLITTEI